jgi:hypothetical protein
MSNLVFGILCFAAGAVTAVFVPAVFNWVKKQGTSVENKLKPPQ